MQSKLMLALFLCAAAGCAKQSAPAGNAAGGAEPSPGEASAAAASEAGAAAASGTVATPASGSRVFDLGGIDGPLEELPRLLDDEFLARRRVTLVALDGKLRDDSYRYDGAGHLLEHEWSSRGEPVWRTTWVWKDGRVVSEKVEGLTGQQGGLAEIEYDSAGREIARRTTYDDKKEWDEPGPDEVERRSYDDAGRLLRQTRTDPYSMLERSFEYDDQGRILRRTVKRGPAAGPADNLEFVETREYDGARLSRVTMVGPARKDELRFAYDEEGRLSRVEFFEAGDPITVKHIRYDERGMPASHEVVSSVAAVGSESFSWSIESK